MQSTGISSHDRRNTHSLDEKAQAHAKTFLSSNNITENVIRLIGFLYQEVGAEKMHTEEGKFESAYQLSITPLFEFYFGRLLYWLSERAEYGWKVCLRRQVQHCAQDIRIEKEGRTIAIVEIEIKGGWIQPVLSSERFDMDNERFAQNKSDFDPTIDVAKLRAQLDRYRNNFKSDDNEPLVFMFLPTFSMVYRKKYTGYKANFSNNTHPAAERLVVLSESLTIDLAKSQSLDDENKQLTSELEHMLQSITRATPNIPAMRCSGAKMLQVPVSATA